MRLLPLILVSLLLLPPFVTASPPPAHDAEGSIVVGTGAARLSNGLDHFTVTSPADATGFNLTGNVHYIYRSFSGGTHVYYIVDVVAALGARDVPFTLDWTLQGDADVTLSPGTGNDCNVSLDVVHYCLT